MKKKRSERRRRAVHEGGKETGEGGTARESGASRRIY